MRRLCQPVLYPMPVTSVSIRAHSPPISIPSYVYRRTASVCLLPVSGSVSVWTGSAFREWPSLLAPCSGRAFPEVVLRAGLASPSWGSGKRGGGESIGGVRQHGWLGALGVGGVIEVGGGEEVGRSGSLLGGRAVVALSPSPSW